MKTKILFASLFLGFGLLSQALIAQGGPPSGRGQGRPDSAPIANPDECPYAVDGECPGCQLGAPEACPNVVDGTCPGIGACPNVEQPGQQGPRPNPDAQPKRDGSGGPGKPANPDGPRDGSAPGRGYRGGRG